MSFCAILIPEVLSNSFALAVQIWLICFEFLTGFEPWEYNISKQVSLRISCMSEKYKCLNRGEAQPPHETGLAAAAASGCGISRAASQTTNVMHQSKLSAKRLPKRRIKRWYCSTMLSVIILFGKTLFSRLTRS